jgi:hypothetical protein
MNPILVYERQDQLNLESLAGIVADIQSKVGRAMNL